MAHANYTVAELAQLCGAKLIGPKEHAIKYLLTDSRRLIFAADTIFFALTTTSNDGHKYIADLYLRGVRAFVVQANFSTEGYPDASFLVVEDGLEALQKIAGAHRQKFNYPVVGITGSNGKTIVKEWLFQLLQKKMRVVRSPRSYNSQIGVPLSLWQMASVHEVALIEAGISMPGEMARLEQMIKPTIGVFTNIGLAHAEGFNSLESKAEQKAILFKDSNSVVYCKDHELVEKALLKTVDINKTKLISWSYKSQPSTIYVQRQGRNLTVEFDGLDHNFSLPFSDEGSIENCIHALICSWHLGVPIADLQEAVAHLTPVEMRLQERRGTQGNLLINDFYNSDPQSIRIALDLLQQQPDSRGKVVVISDFEGLAEAERSDQYHQLVSVLNSMPLKEVVCIGSEWLNYIAGIHHDKHVFMSTEELISALPKLGWQNCAILLKGARKFKFEKIAGHLQEQLHQTWLEVNLSSIAHNLRYYRSHIQQKTKTMAMVKALSYGSGTTEIARWLQYNRVDYLAVAYVNEGITLRKGGISMPILVMNPDPLAFGRMIEYQLEPELYSLQIAKEFLAVLQGEYAGAEKYPVHLKVETGMHRLGLEDDLYEVLDLIQDNNSVYVQSIFSHLVASDNPQLDDFTREQIAGFNRIAKKAEEILGYTVIKHIANTSAVSRFKEAELDMVRLGIGLYGSGNSREEQTHLKTVTYWYTRVSQIKNIKPGDSVGYNRSFIAQENMKIATLPVGYADGYFRLLSNGKGQVFANGKRVPVVGKVCMDMIMVEVTGLQLKEGDIVELLGNHISVHDMAKAAQTIPYEIFTHISSRVPRVYLTE